MSPKDGTPEVLATIAAWSDANRGMGERLHAVITTTAPDLKPRLWYGMPGYAKDGKVVVFFRGTDKFKERYMTLGFNEEAKLDDGTMWPTSYALTELDAAGEARVAALVKQAVS